MNKKYNKIYSLIWLIFLLSAIFLKIDSFKLLSSYNQQLEKINKIVNYDLSTEPLVHVVSRLKEKSQMVNENLAYLILFDFVFFCIADYIFCYS